jgi:hypothetical protein
MSDGQTLPNSFDSYVIEVRPQLAGRTVQAGIVVRDRGQFRFFAAADDFSALEGRAFPNPKAAEQAVIRWASDQSRRPLSSRTPQQSR